MIKRPQKIHPDIEQACKLQVLEDSGLYDFFIKNGSIEYRYKRRAEFFKKGTSLITVAIRQRTIQWLKDRGLISLV